MASSEAAVTTPWGASQVPQELADSWRRVLATRHQPQVEHGLRLIANGYSVMAAAVESGASRNQLTELAAKYNLVSSKLLIGGQKRIAFLAQAKVEQDYLEGEVSHAQAAIDAGIAHDKIAKYEGWGKPAPTPSSNYTDAIAQLTAALNTGESLTITVTKSSSDPVADAVDVTPT